MTTELSRLPTTTQEAWEWQYEGICRSVDPWLFFHPDGERGAARRRRDEAAVALCVRCPVIESCRRHALSVREPYGVWGGLTEKDRQSDFPRSPSAVPSSEDADESLTLMACLWSEDIGEISAPRVRRAAASA